MSYFVCPYCGKEINADLSEYNRENEKYTYDECPHCGKSFVFCVEWIKTVDTYKAPCLNGEPHNWEKIVGYPKEFYQNRRRCSYCDEEKILEKTDEP